MPAISEELRQILMDQLAADLQRGIPPITEEQLTDFLNEAQAEATKELLAEHCLDPFAWLVVPVPPGEHAESINNGLIRTLAGGRLALLNIPLPLPEDAAGKTQMFHRLRGICQLMAAMAVVVVSDGWTLWNDDKTGPGTTKEGMDYVAKHGSASAAKAGHGTLTEILMANAQTRDRMIVRAIPYERRFKGGVLLPNGQNPLGVPHTISVLDHKAFVLRFPEEGNVYLANAVLIYKASDPA